jgi:cytochrome c oxidase assembly factor CtaG
MRAPRIARTATTVLLSAHFAPALAHGVAPAGEPLAFGWRFAPWVTALLALALALYGVGFARLARRGEAGRSSRRIHAAAFAAGWLTLALVLVSPLDALSGALFSAHMVEHEAMMLVSAPLIVLGRPLGVMLWALPHQLRLRIGRALRSRIWTACWRRLASPMWAWSLHALALWAWHAPYLFEAAVAHPFVHTLQHSSFLLTALLFWRGIFGEGATRRASGHAMLSLFTTMVHTGALGALIALAPGIWYPSYIEPTSALGVDPLHDQQLGGLIMWIPGALAYLIGALVVAARWLREQPTASHHRVWAARGARSPLLEEPPR